MDRMKKIIILFLFSIVSLFSKESSYVIYEPKFSPYAGAENLFFIFQGSGYILSKYISIPEKKNFLYMLGRFAEVTAIYYPLSRIEVVLQHEVFGHGYRIRDIGSNIAVVNRYVIDAPFPYGNGGGATYYFYNENMTSFLEASVSIAGVEATSIFANRMKIKWLSYPRLDPLKSLLYIESQHDITSYIDSMDDFLPYDDEGHDIEDYLFWLNNTYYRDFLSKKKLKKPSLINFLDPYTYYS